MASLYKMLGIGYVLAVIGLLWEIFTEVSHGAAAPYTQTFAVVAVIGFVVYYLFVHFAPPPTEEHK